MVGKTISHYNITEKIGEGGMGEVYLADDTKLKRQVAIKFLPEHLTKDTENVERFEREAEAAAALNHPNIVTIHDVIEEDGNLCIVMEYVEGKSLRDVIDEYNLGQDKIIDIISQLSEGLSKSHKAGIVHRDIKPENIIIDHEARVKILDFGLAKLKGVSKLTKETSTLGTIHYMSPEQLQGKEVDHRSDIWSLGVVLYEMLTGDVPFKGDYDQAVAYSIQSEEFEPIDDIAPEHIEVLHKLLAKEPNDRYQNLEELIDVLIEKKESRGKKRIGRQQLYLIYSMSLIVLLIVGYLVIMNLNVDISQDSSTEWKNSIAVLPFTDLSPEGNQEWFCDGITEEILTNLGNLKKLKVIARTSVMKYKNTLKSASQIGKEINVENILKGSASKIGNRVRIRSQLIRIEDEVQLWSESYDYEYKVDNIFTIFDNITEKIATNLLVALTPEEKKKIELNRPSNTEAYEFYQKGRYFHHDKYRNSKNEIDLLTSEKMFKTAIKLDPNYAESYASLSDLYNSYYNHLPDTASERNKYMLLQEAYLDTAYQLDPKSAEVISAKGWVHSAKSEPVEAFNSFKTAIKVNPNNDYYYWNLGNFLFKKGCNNLAIKCINKAIEINPLNDNYYRYRGTLYWEIDDYNNAEISYKKWQELNPTFSGHLVIWELLVERKRYIEAKKLMAQIKVNYPDEDFSAVNAIQYAIDGEKEKALSIFKSAKEDFPFKTTLFASLKMEDELIIVLQELFKSNQGTKFNRYLSLKNRPIYNLVRSDPRFQKILAQRKELYEENLEKYGDIDI